MTGDNNEDVNVRVKHLIGKRGQIKGKITRLSNFLEQGGEYVDLTYVNERAQVTSDAVKLLGAINNELTSLEPEVDHDSAFEDIICDYQKVMAWVRRVNDLPNLNGSRNELRSLNTASASSLIPESVNSRLPKINLKNFDGTLEKWRSYRDWFITNIHNRKELSDATKLDYLHATLKGEAAKTIEAFEPTDNNYVEAWKLLGDTYDNEYVLILRHYDLLLETPSMKHNNAEELRNLLNRVQTHLLAMKALGEDIDQWNTTIVHTLIKRLHKDTAREWNRQMKGTKMPKKDDLLAFLREEATRLTAVNTSTIQQAQASNSFNAVRNFGKRPIYNRASLLTGIDASCPSCKGNHSLNKCEHFLLLNVNDKIKAARAAAVCLNCFNRNHKTRLCKSTSRCSICQKNHHTLLHLTEEDWNTFKKPVGQLTTNIAKTNLQQNPVLFSTDISQAPSSTALVAIGPSNDLLTTAAVEVYDKNGDLIKCRALLDTCSSSNFMTNRLAKKLGLSMKKCNIKISAIDNACANTEFLVNAKIKSRVSDYSRSLSFLTVNSIGGLQPPEAVNTTCLKIPKGIKLADPEYFKPAEVDLLLSSGTTLSMLQIGQIQGVHPNHPDIIFQKTRLGWIIGGSTKMDLILSRPAICKVSSITNSEDFDLKKFWEVEETAPTLYLSQEEKACEEHFTRTFSRSNDGRYTLALPFKESYKPLGESIFTAKKRLLNQIKRMNAQPEFKQRYITAMQEYIDLGYMTEVENSSSDNSDGFFLPHHAVIKSSSTTTKLRIVFDGSASSSTGSSLNDVLMIGPVIQERLFNLLISFRGYRYVLTGDIQKMYLQFWIRPEDRKYQRVLWLDSAGKIKTYELNTVTFGIAPSSFLAIRALQQLALDEGDKYPQASRVLRRDMYVDDCLTGAQTLAEATQILSELQKLLPLGGLKMRQWASNEPKLLVELPESDIKQNLALEDHTIKTLGLRWNATEDLISYNVSEPESDKKITKRTILSNIAKIFDPLGLLSPVLTKAKLIMQQLWKDNFKWDESVSMEIRTSWKNYSAQLPSLNELKFPRMIVLPDATDIQLHGFCDASMSAYGACMYARSVDKNGKIKVVLLCGKSRVAPVKTVSLPRLELCGALLLTELYQVVIKAITVKITRVVFWTDSTIVCHWINTSPHLLQTFVANRVSEIQKGTNAQDWRHVRSEENPADAISRGEMPLEFIHNELWPVGPSWLQFDEEKWPKLKISPPKEKDVELRKSSCLITNERNEILLRFSKMERLRRFVAYSLRFKSYKKGDKIKSILTVEELTAANSLIIKLVQETMFSEEINRLKKGKEISTTSNILSLSPFLDNDGLLRVGGRLKNSLLPRSQKHPLLMPKSHHVTDLLINEARIRQFHAGAQSTLYALRRQYWIVSGRSQVRLQLRKCLTCFKCKPVLANFQMGDLPKARVTPGEVFYNTGIDYCGPFFIKEKRKRNRSKIKIYVAVFICMWSKAIHLEVVEDLTTEGFLGALSRFIDRRGRCTNFYSDNGTNFVGANSHLKELYALLHSDASLKQIHDHLAKERIKWHFMPPQTPHFGGLWESGVKSFKYHMKRIVGEKLFTSIEFQTYVTRVEAVLNSRPLSYISCDPNDPIPLTPGHFLIGKSLMSLPEPNYSSVSTNRLSNWQHIMRMKREFWNRWSKEYITDLNIKHKWNTNSVNLDVDTIVMMKDDNLHPMQWSLGRVVEVFPGDDGIVRVVRIRIGDKTFKRNVRNLAPLPRF